MSHSEPQNILWKLQRLIKTLPASVRNFLMYQIYPCGQKNAILSTQKRQRCHINQYFGSETDYVNLIGSRNSTRAATLLFQLRTAAFKAYCAIWVRRSNFRHQASPRVSPRESTQRRNVELWARNVR